MSIDGIKRRIPKKHRGNHFDKKYHSSPQSKYIQDNINEDADDFKDNFEIKPLINVNSSQENTKWKFFKKALYIISLFLFSIILSFGLYFVWKLSNVSVKINSSSSEEKSSLLQTFSSLTSRKNIELRKENNRINILLLGIAGKGRAGGNLTDTIMIASIDTKKNKVALLSLPRDLYVSIPNTTRKTKINAIYKIGLNEKLGVEPLKKSITEITGLSIDYYLIANFSGFEKFIDDIGGINIQVDRDIYDPHYPGLNYSYELFEIKKGFHKMDGSTALKYARERHNDPEGDFGRAKRQQQVLQSIKNKVFSTHILFNPFKLNTILNTLGDNIKTDASLNEIKSFLELLKQVDTQNINNVVVDAWKKDSLLKVSHIFMPDGVRMFILIPRIGNYSEIQDLAKNIFNLNIIKHRQREIKKENANIAIINKSSDNGLSNKLLTLLKDKLKFENIKIIQKKSSNEISETKVVDNTNRQKPFSLDELIKKLPATLSTDSNKNAILNKENLDDYSKYDFIILLGDDLKEIYKYKEDSIEDLNSEANIVTL